MLIETVLSGSTASSSSMCPSPLLHVGRAGETRDDACPRHFKPTSCVCSPSSPSECSSHLLLLHNQDVCHTGTSTAKASCLTTTPTVKVRASTRSLAKLNMMSTISKRTSRHSESCAQSPVLPRSAKESQMSLLASSLLALRLVRLDSELQASLTRRTETIKERRESMVGYCSQTTRAMLLTDDHQNDANRVSSAATSR